MNTYTKPRLNNWILAVGPRSMRTTMMIFIARLAEHEHVRVLDSSTQFNGYLISRLLGGRVNMREQISLSHSHTCHQTLAWLEQAEILPASYILLDFLRPFYAQTTPLGERRKLLECCVSHLNRLSKSASGIVSIHPPSTSSIGVDEFGHLLQTAASYTWIQLSQPQPFRPVRSLN